MKQLLTETEMVGIRSMNLYWNEVAKRDDKSPLNFEVDKIVRLLGHRLLPIIADYAETGLLITRLEKEKLIAQEQKN